MIHCPDALEADFQRVYGLDLGDLWAGRMTVPRAANLTTHLPWGSAIFRAMGLDQAWTTGEHLAAQSVDLMAAANWQRGGGKGSRPKPIPRPSEAKALEDRKERDRLRALRHRAKRRAEV